MGDEVAGAGSALTPGDLLRLRVSVFVAGAAVMVIEVVGTRVIGPHFGASLFVWTALITVTMVALAAGYWVGGPLADRRPEPRVFFGLLMVAALATAIVPVVRRPVIELASALGLRAGSLAAATILFFPALFVLGMVSPFAARLAAQSIGSVGQSTGRLYALSTAGSVLGAVLTGFVLIPNLRIPTVLVSVAAALLAAGLAGWRLSKPAASAGAALVFLCAVALASPGAPPPALVEIRPSAYTDLRVVEDGGARYLLADGMIQTVITKDSKVRSAYPYFLVARVAQSRPAARRALVIGLGGGALAGMLESRGMVVDAVELDPAVVDVARRHFGYRGGDERVSVDDGRVVLAQAKAKWDLIVLDAFTGERLPTSLLTREAISAARDALTEGGMLVVNVLGFDVDHPTAAATAIYSTIASVLPNALALPAGLPGPDGRLERANLLIFGSAAPIEPVSGEVTLDTFDGPRPFRWGGFFPMRSSPGEVVTDDANPLDTLDLEGVERLRRRSQSSAPPPILEALWYE